MGNARNLLAGFGRILGILSAGLLAAWLVLPLIALGLEVDPSALAARLASPATLEALRLTFVTASLSTLIVVALGTPLAYFLTGTRFRGRRLLETAVDLAMVLPPAAAGAGLWFAFGRAGLLGRPFEALGLQVSSSMVAVVLAQVFVAAPFFVSSLVQGLRAVEPRYLEVASTLRAPPGALFLRVALPLAAPSLAAGAGLALARALGEFGAILTFAGNLPGVSRTLPLAVAAALESDPQAAIALSLLLVAASFVVLLGLKALPAGLVSGGQRAARHAG